MCPTEEAVSFAKEMNLCCILCNHNAFLNENIFFIDKTIPKSYNAVINSGIVPIKRHHLLTKVDHLALIVYDGIEQNKMKDSYYNRILSEIKYDFINEKTLTHNDVNIILNRSKVGVIMSVEEGANYATGEYLLCGIPVVSNECRGGREYWFDDYNSFIVSENPTEQEIADAVMQAIKENRNSEKIRKNYLLKANINRRNMATKLNEIINEKLLPFQWVDYINDFIHSGNRICTYHNWDAWDKLTSSHLLP
jgi:glycosyltransferase involved in cell wall biosynthesis